ncbi:isoprenoid synthase domain-containing protein [Mycena pura]|uniref:Isoprenoid synthase domain-containing protein n=1 Tax=Mycena pura TaxID=153505 RepID=A0AAD6UYF2_9AGAR|nr:isoprenoid synthase domain-containing protein [Mycena pura]
MHSMEDVACTANRDLKAEWTAAHGEPPSKPAGESPHGHVAAVAVPECLPERLYMCAYIMDYMICYDQLADADSDADKPKAMEARLTYCADLKGGTDFTSPSKALGRQMIHRLMALNQPSAAALMHEWELYTEYIIDSFTKEFSTLDEYIEHRLEDAGIPVYFATSGFGTACLPLTPEEKSLAAPLLSCLGKACALANDYYSWDKELAAHKAGGGHGRVNNCVTWIMEQYSCGIDAARVLLKEKIWEYERQFEELWRNWGENGVEVKPEDEGKVDVDRVQRYVQAAMFATSGSTYWHARAPRYKIGK